MKSFETSDALQIHYQVRGSSDHPTLLLLHGLGADHQMWSPQLETFPDQGYHVVAPDLRGHGRSSRPKAFSLDDCARDVRELLDHLGVDAAHVIGVSMGGLIAQRLACDAPTRVKTLILVDTFSSATQFPERLYAWFATTLLTILPKSAQSRLIANGYERLGKPKVAKYFESRLEVIPKDALIEMRRAVNRFDILDRLDEIKLPTRVLVGDGFGQNAIRMAKKSAEAIPNAEFRILEGGGDPSNLLVPQAFNQAVFSFLAEEGYQGDSS